MSKGLELLALDPNGDADNIVDEDEDAELSAQEAEDEIGGESGTSRTESRTENEESNSSPTRSQETDLPRRPNHKIHQSQSNDHQQNQRSQSPNLKNDSTKNNNNRTRPPEAKSSCPKPNNSAELTRPKSSSSKTASSISHNVDDYHANTNNKRSNGSSSGGESNNDNSNAPINHTNKKEKIPNEIKNAKDSANHPDYNKPLNNSNISNSVNGNGNFGNNSSSVKNSPSTSENNIRISPSRSPREINAKNNRKANTPNNSSTRKGERLSVTVPGSPFESGVNTECIQLLRQLWSVHEEAVQFLERIRAALSYFRGEVRAQENEFECSFREKRLSNVNFPNNSISKKKYGVSGGGGAGSGVDVPSLISRGSKANDDLERKQEPWVPLQIFIDGLKCISDYFSDIDKQYLTLSVFQSQCKLALFAKVKHAKQQVDHDRLSIMHGVQQLISVTLHLISTPEFWTHSDEDRTTLMVQNVLQLTEIYNGYLESSTTMPMEAALVSSTSTTSLANPNLQEIDTSLVPPIIPKPNPPKASDPSVVSSPPSPSNDPKASSSLPNKLRILVQIRAANRNNSPLLRLTLKPLSATRLLQILAQKRSTFAAHAFSRVTLSSFYSDSKGILTVDKFEPCFTDEDSRLSPLGKGFSQCPSLLGRAAVKKTENGDQRLSRSARTKMYSYFHEVLWTLAGEHSEDLLLWGLHSNIIPLVLQPLEAFIALRNALMMAQHFQESNLSPMLSAFDSVGGALHSFSLLANWDKKMREAFEETYKVKRPEQVVLVRKPEPLQWATEIGSKFGQIVTSCISLIDSGNENLPNKMRSTLMRLSSNEEEPLGDEAQTLFRLEATLVYFKAWVVKRAKVWLNGWAIPQFLACSQREPALLVKLIKSRESVLITRDLLLNNENVSIRLSAKHRQMCAEDLRTALHQLQSMPEELLQAVGPVCSTLSLATLQSYMPPANHWKAVGRGSGLDPDKPSTYVNVFIERVIEPVMTASVEFVPGPVQEAMGKQVVHAACDAWLEYILQKKIRFSEWGAVQLLRDFTAFREWIHTETELEKEARKSILQLEVLKRCEGVAYLLLRNPGDVLGVGKPTRKNRRVAPSSSASVESSPSVADSSTAEDDSIPPEMYVPNQQMWLELRLRRGVFMSPCCQ